MASLLTTILAILQAALSLYAGQKSYLAIINLYSNEDRAEKAAKHSDGAWRELWRTRLTQASGALTVLLSLTSARTLLFHLNTTPEFLAMVNITVEAAMYIYITSFWKAKAEIPLIAKEYNEGIRKSNDLRRLLVALGVGWAVTGAVGYLAG